MKRKGLFGLVCVLVLLAVVLAGCKKDTVLRIKVYADSAAEAPMEEIMEQYRSGHKNVVFETTYDTSENLYNRIVDYRETCDFYLTDDPAKLDLLDVRRSLVSGTVRTLMQKESGGTTTVYAAAKMENRNMDIEQSEAVGDFLEYLTGDAAQEIFRKYGFDSVEA